MYICAQMRKRYLFFDIDGTLIAGGYYGNNYIPASTMTAIRKLKEDGHFLCLATGRSEALSRAYMEECGIDNMVSDGGYGITIDGELLGIRPLPREDVIALIRECDRKGIPWALQTDNSDTRLAPDGRFNEVARDIYQKTRIVPRLDPEDFENLYKAFIAGYYPMERSIESLKRLPWCRFQDEYIFVEPADKAAGIHRMLEHFGGRPEDAIVFGDSKNDLSMFGDDGWIRVAMGNASDELKEKADLVTTDVDQDGIWNACVALGLVKPD